MTQEGARKKKFKKSFDRSIDFYGNYWGERKL